MSNIGKTLHVVSTVLLALAFLGTGAYVVDVSTGLSGSGANIGLGIIMPFCLGGGVIGVVLAIVALIMGSISRTRGNRPV